MRASWEYVTTVYNNIASSHVCGSVTCKVQIKPLDFLYMTLPPQGRHTVGFVDGEGTGTHFGVKKPWRDNIDSSKFSPFSCKRLSKVRNECLAAVVDRLINRNVDNVGTHAGCDDEVSEALTVEHLADIFGTEHDSIN